MKSAAVIGAGVFGLFCALELLRRGFRVHIYEQAKHLGQGASKVNQARLHLGYHYPRSKETALQCIKGFEKFQRRFPQSINRDFTQYYVIAKEDSKTTSEEYISFCRDLSLPFKIVKLGKDVVDDRRIDLCVEVPEVAFDYDKVISPLIVDIRTLGGRLLLNHRVIAGDVKGAVKRIEYRVGENNRGGARAYDIVVNAAYANINGLNQVFGLPKVPLAFELCEMALVSVPQEYNSIGVTIMDGNFCAIMPFGLSGYQTISDVRRTPHERADSDLPVFSCNADDSACGSGIIKVCDSCHRAPGTNLPRMVALARRYLPYARHIKLVRPMFAVKAILNNVEDTDARPSKIYAYSQAENYFVLFAGKIDTVIDLVDEVLKMLK